MMSPPQSLHTLARRYCIERSEKAEFLPWKALDKILCEVERLDHDALPALDDLKDYLLTVGQEISASAPGAPKSPEEPDGAFELQQECELFRAYIHSIKDSDLVSVPPLPYRRVLSEEEIRTLKEQIARKIEGVPLSSVHRDWSPFVATLGNEGLRELFIKNDITRLYELQKSPDRSHLLDISLWDPEWAPMEIDWTSGNLDWVIRLGRLNFMATGWIADLITSNANHPIRPPAQARECTPLRYQTYGVFPDDSDREEFWLLIHWCLEKGADEFIPIESTLEIFDPPKYLSYFVSRFRRFQLPLKKRKEYADGWLWIHTYRLTSESLDLLKRIFPDGNLVLYRQGEVMLYAVLFSTEGHIILREDEVEEFKTLGISFGEPPLLF